MKAGDLDRRLRIERRVMTQEPVYGTSSEAWELVAIVPAQVRDILPSRAEEQAADMNVAARPARVRIRYRAGITSAMRFVMGDRIMQIISGPAEIGRCVGMEFMVEDLSTRGEDA